MKTKTVFAVTVKTKNFMSDFFQFIKNAVGMNLTTYEEMIEDAIEESIYKLLNKFPDAYDLNITTTQVIDGACEIVVFGKVDYDK